MGLFDFIKSKNKTETTETKKEDKSIKKNELTVRVVGTEYRNQAEIISLGKYNSDYELNKRAMFKKYPNGYTASEYTFPEYAATLEFEPTNEHDPNAIKVMIQNIHVGYVKSGSCSRVRNLINQNKIKSISAKIQGGNSKSLYSYGECEGEKLDITDFEFEKNTDKFRVTLTLILTE